MGFGRVLGEVWDLLGVSWGTFSPLFLRLCCQEGPRGPKRRPRSLLASIWDGFGGILGGQNGEQIEIFCIFLDNNKFNGGMVKNTFFTMGGPSIR